MRLFYEIMPNYVINLIYSLFLTVKNTCLKIQVYIEREQIEFDWDEDSEKMAEFISDTCRVHHMQLICVIRLL